MRQLCCPYFPGSEDAYPGMFHTLHILHLHILHILQELHKISLMDGWQDNMLASGQEGANAGLAAVPASAAGPAPITSNA